MDLERTFTFRNSKQTYSGIPIIVANMDTVGTFEMAAVMSQVGTQPRHYILSFFLAVCVSGAWSHSLLSLIVTRDMSFLQSEDRPHIDSALREMV